MRCGAWLTGEAGGGDVARKPLFVRQKLAQRLDMLLYLNGVRKLALVGARGVWGSPLTKMDLRPLLFLKNLRTLHLEAIEADFGTPRRLF